VGGCERRLDVQNVGKLGFSKDRFPTSLCRHMKRSANAQDVLEMPTLPIGFDGCQSAFDHDPPLSRVPGDTHVASSKGCPPSTLTKGSRAAIPQDRSSGLPICLTLYKLFRKVARIIRDVWPPRRRRDFCVDGRQ